MATSTEQRRIPVITTERPTPRYTTEGPPAIWSQTCRPTTEDLASTITTQISTAFPVVQGERLSIPTQGKAYLLTTQGPTSPLTTRVQTSPFTVERLPSQPQIPETFRDSQEKPSPQQRLNLQPERRRRWTLFHPVKPDRHLADHAHNPDKHRPRRHQPDDGRRKPPPPWRGGVLGGPGMHHATNHQRTPVDHQTQNISWQRRHRDLPPPLPPTTPLLHLSTGAPLPCSQTLQTQKTSPMASTPKTTNRGPIRPTG
ncbi:unnamed protein product [Gadus morhua 'NCC']